MSSFTVINRGVPHEVPYSDTCGRVSVEDLLTSTEYQEVLSGKLIVKTADGGLCGIFPENMLRNKFKHGSTIILKEPEASDFSMFTISKG